VARRGDELREHILWEAKNVFIELGFERTSMDVVAARASTSKRSLYAHFESKDKLFLDVIDLARGLYVDKLAAPGQYSDDPAQAVVLFCGRFLQLLLYKPALRTCRMTIAEAERLPEAASRYYDAIFATTQDRLASFIGERYPRIAADKVGIAHELLGVTVYPRLFSALLGLDENAVETREPADIPVDVDLAAIRTAAAALLPA
jgi:AcrR family transcriptional regulator